MGAACDFESKFCPNPTAEFDAVLMLVHQSKETLLLSVLDVKATCSMSVKWANRPVHQQKGELYAIHSDGYYTLDCCEWVQFAANVEFAGCTDEPDPQAAQQRLFRGANWGSAFRIIYKKEGFILRDLALVVAFRDYGLAPH